MSHILEDIVAGLLKAEDNVVVEHNSFSGINGWKACVLCGAGNIIVDTVTHELDCPITLAHHWRKLTTTTKGA
jgi:hypothetical protein